MQISIIVLIYKTEAYIKRCIESIIMQDFDSYELILVDDASPDKATMMAEELLNTSNIPYQRITHQSNKGTGSSRNAGVEAAQGKYIMFVDSDDFLPHNNVLKTYYDKIKDDRYDFVSANYNTVQIINNKVKHAAAAIGIKQSTAYSEQASILHAFLHNMFPTASWGKLIKKSFLHAHDITFVEGSIIEDQLWSFRICIAATSIFCLSDYNYSYYKTNPKAISVQNDKRVYKDLFDTIDSICEQIQQQSLLNANNKKGFSFYFSEKFDTILERTYKHAPDNKNEWTKTYERIQNLYVNKLSTIGGIQPLCKLSANTAYFIYFHRQKPPYKNKCFRPLATPFYLLNIYNIWGLSGFWTKLNRSLKKL